MMIRSCGDCERVERAASGQLRCAGERAMKVCDRFEWRDSRHAALEIAHKELEEMCKSDVEHTSMCAEYIMHMMDKAMEQRP